MRIYRGLAPQHLRSDCVAAIGNFDGMHIGHQTLIARVVQKAAACGMRAAAVTFEPHPRDYFASKVPPARISSLRDKAGDMAALGLDDLYVLHFDRHMASLPAQRFAQEILHEGLHARHIVIGDDFRFGSDRQGCLALLQSEGSRLGFTAESLMGVALPGGLRASSTHLREAISRGDTATAEALLGHRVRITGRIVHGAQLGRTIGFPTLNVRMLPPGFAGVPAIRGVWAVRILGLEDEPLDGVASLGIKPTVTDERRWTLEVNVFDWKGNAYGRIARIEFIAKLRDEKKFAGLDELRQAIRQDAQRARSILEAPWP